MDSWGTQVIVKQDDETVKFKKLLHFFDNFYPVKAWTYNPVMLYFEVTR